MYNSYYLKNAKSFEQGKIPVQILNNSDEVFNKLANLMIDTIKENNEKGENTVYILPVGPIGQYPFFVKKVLEEKISLKNCWFINMDEYLSDDKTYISYNDKLSFRAFMDNSLYSLLPNELNVPKSQRIFPDPNDLDKIDNIIKELGKVDICFGGIGINGHLAFNEPEDLSNEEFLSLNTRILKISQETRIANGIGDLHGAIENMPKYAITIGMKQIFSARKIYLGVFRDWHKAVLRRAIFSNSSSSFPVSLIQKHSNAVIISNDIAAADIL